MDQTGRFPCESSRENNYIFLCYNYDTNTILVKAITNREMENIIDTWRSYKARLTKNGHITKNTFCITNAVRNSKTHWMITI